MSQDYDYQRLARHFMDLWQEQMSMAMNDSEFIRGLLQMMQSMQMSGKDNPAYANPFATKSSGGAAAAPDTRDAALARIELGLADLARRIATLEHAAGQHTTSVAAKRKAKPRLAAAAKRPKARAGSRGRSKKKGR